MVLTIVSSSSSSSSSSCVSPATVVEGDLQKDAEVRTAAMDAEIETLRKLVNKGNTKRYFMLNSSVSYYYYYYYYYYFANNVRKI
jgi:hypothetical protein